MTSSATSTTTHLRDELFGTPERSVMDPVHGAISFFEHERSIIDHRLFQRLRHVVQNDVTNLVFPGATHTRFQHSLGSMHIAGRTMKALIRSYLLDLRGKRTRPLSDKQSEAVRYLSFCLRLAALLHDTGHFPFSHQIEASRAFAKLLQQTDLPASLWPRKSWKMYYDRRPESLSHEHYSVVVAHRILKEVESKLPVDKRDVIALMETTDCTPTTTFGRHAKALLALDMSDPHGLTLHKFFKTLVSGELDVDKMDYLLRDSFFSGCRYGMYNLDHLLSTIRLGVNPPDQANWVGLAITEKGLGPFEDFVYARFQLYQEVYSHKTVVGLKWLVTSALDDLLRQQKHKAVADRSLRDLDLFADFTDMLLWEQMRGRAQDTDGPARALLARTKLRHLATYRDLGPADKKDKQRAITDQTGKGVIAYESPIKFSKIKPGFEAIRLLSKDPVTGKRSLGSITQSGFFDKFRDVVITQYYEEPVSSVKKRSRRARPADQALQPTSRPQKTSNKQQRSRATRG